MEAATSRMIRIGRSSIGLVGLDLALNHAARHHMDDNQATEYLLTAICKKNYIPSGLEEQYRQALLAAYKKHRDGESDAGEDLIIRIFGPGCAACNGLQNLVLEVMARLQVAADIEQIHDPDEIGRAGILQTPALMINGRIKSMGLHPSPAQVEEWIKNSLSEVHLQ